MKYIRQFGIIIVISFIGEVMKYMIPLPIPASIYGLMLMMVALMTGIIKRKDIEETSDFLLEIMPIMFVPAALGLIDAWVDIKAIWLPILILLVLTTIIVMAVTGKVTQFVIRRDRMKRNGNHEHTKK